MIKEIADTPKLNQILDESIKKSILILDDFFKLNFDRLMGKYN